MVPLFKVNFLKENIPLRFVNYRRFLVFELISYSKIIGSYTSARKLQEHSVNPDYVSCHEKEKLVRIFGSMLCLILINRYC